MYFAHDTNKNFYYLGDTEPHSRMFKEYLVDRNPKLIGCDVETISLKERIAIGISIAVQPNMVFYFPLFPEPSPVMPWNLVKDPIITKIFHNALFDLGCLREYEVDTTNIKDTNVMARLLCYPFTSLSDMTFIHKMEVHDTKTLLGEHNAKTMLELPSEVVARKCMQDSGACLRLFYELNEDINQNYLSVEMQIIPILIEMSNQGLLIDQEARLKLEEGLEEEVSYYLNICDGIGFNPASPQQVAYILAKKGAYSNFTRLPFTNWKKTSLSTAEETLGKMDDPLASLVLNFRHKSKLLNTYIKPWAREERASTRFHLDAITGRPSSTERNMQNIPKGEARGIFIPDTGIWTDMDFSQIELRILAYLSQDREMQYIFKTGGDIHQIAADFLNIPRTIAKNVMFALIYGATDETLMETAHIRSIDRARQLRENIFKLFTGAGDWIESLNHNVPATAQTIFGRNIRLPTEDEERLDGRQRKNINYRIQGSAAEILKRGLILCKDLPMALQVHDEILVDGFIPDYRFKPLESIAPFRTPVEVKYLERWE